VPPCIRISKVKEGEENATHVRRDPTWPNRLHFLPARFSSQQAQAPYTLWNTVSGTCRFGASSLASAPSSYRTFPGRKLSNGLRLNLLLTNIFQSLHHCLLTTRALVRNPVAPRGSSRLQNRVYPLYFGRLHHGQPQASIGALASRLGLTTRISVRSLPPSIHYHRAWFRHGGESLGL